MPEPGLSDLAVLSLAMLAAAAIAAIGARLAIAYAVRNAMLDQPGVRRSHSVATPRGGGIGIVLAMVVLLGVSLRWFPGANPTALWAMLGGLLAVAAVGWWDDHRDLSAGLRLVVHLLAGLGVSVALLGWPESGRDGLVVAVATLWVAGLVNLWNFMDGINGIATAQAAVVAMALTWLPGAAQGAWLLLGLGLSAACLGFLPFNFPRARVFLGDVGSGALGFLVAVQLLAAATVTGPGYWPLLLLLPLVFLLDAGLTLAWRVLRGRRWWRPHREHVYQWAVRRGHSHHDVTLAYTTAAVVAAIIAGMSWAFPGILAWSVLLVVALALVVTGGRLRQVWAGMARRRRTE